MLTIEDSMNLAVQHHRSGEIPEAERIYREILRIDPSHSDALHLLGVTAQQSQQPHKAIDYISQAVALNPASAVYHCNLAGAYRATGNIVEALRFYRLSLQLQPDSTEALKHLGTLLGEQQEWEAAIACYSRVRELDPNDAKTHLLLGNAFSRIEETDSAIDCYERAFQLDPELPRLAVTLGNAYKSGSRLDDARDSFQHALRQQPDDPDALIALGNVLKAQDEPDEAAACYRKALRNQPRQFELELWLASLCPSVFRDSSAIDAFRAKLSEGLQQLDPTEFQIDPLEIASAGQPAPYNLQFHGRDDRVLKENYASLFLDAFRRPEKPRGIRNGKPRIGFAMTLGHEGVFLRFMQGVLARMNPARFELTVICPEQTSAEIRSRIGCDHVAVVGFSSQTARAVETIRNLHCDVLYHWEVGSDSFNYFLPFFKLAPVQCTSGGLPVTTGIPSMDYYLSSNLAECEQADSHYSETLIRAESQLSYQQRVRLPARTKSRAEFGFSSTDHLYLCAQKIEKFHPDFDPLLAGILHQDARGRIVIPKDKGGYRARKLQARIAENYPDLVERLTFLPHLSLDDYYSLIQTADVLLDPLYYGGGLSAYDAFSLSKPVVTLPTEFVRGRFTYGFYRRMEIDDCIATNGDEYVAIAVSLGTNAEKRGALTRRIEVASELLFEDPQAVRDYEMIFERLVAHARTQCEVR